MFHVNFSIVFFCIQIYRFLELFWWWFLPGKVLGAKFFPMAEKVRLNHQRFPKSEARGNCFKGSSCKFAHGLSALRAKPDRRSRVYDFPRSFSWNSFGKERNDRRFLSPKMFPNCHLKFGNILKPEIWIIFQSQQFSGETCYFSGGCTWNHHRETPFVISEFLLLQTSRCFLLPIITSKFFSPSWWKGLMGPSGLEQDQDVFHFQEDGYLQSRRGALKVAHLRAILFCTQKKYVIKLQVESWKLFSVEVRYWFFPLYLRELKGVFLIPTFFEKRTLIQEKRKPLQGTSRHRQKGLTLKFPYLEDHPRTCKWLVSPPFIFVMKKAIWKGNNPILRGLANHGY